MPGKAEAAEPDAAPRILSSGAPPVPGPAARRITGDRTELPNESAGPPSAGRGSSGHRKAAEIPLPTGPTGGGGPTVRLADAHEPAPARDGARVDAGENGLHAFPPGLPATDPWTRDGEGTAAPVSAATPSPAADSPSPLFEQLAMKLTPMPDGEHTVEMRLAPERLGGLNIELRIASGRIDASLRADNPEARSLLLREEPALREALRNAGITLSSYHVALANDPHRERRGTSRPDADAGTPQRRNRRETPVEGIAPARGGAERTGAPDRTEHWIA
ncbi:MAG: hypothetical protein OHK0028_09170 [Deltaproteobacteria bacterium]